MDSRMWYRGIRTAVASRLAGFNVLNPPFAITAAELKDSSWGSSSQDLTEIGRLEADIVRVARGHYKRNPFAGRVVDFTERMTLGAMGVRLEITNDDALQELWADIERQPLVEEGGWQEGQSRMMERMVVDGECYLLTWPIEGEGLRFKLFWREDLDDGDESATSDNEDGKNQNGEPAIDYDSHGRPASYRFKLHSEGSDDKVFTVEAQDVVHVFFHKFSRMAGRRGQSWILSVVDRLQRQWELETSLFENALDISQYPGYENVDTQQFQILTGKDIRESDTLKVEDMTYRRPKGFGRIAYRLMGMTGANTFVSRDRELHANEILAEIQDLRLLIALRFGWGYNRVGGDLKGINFSTGRLSMLDDVDTATILQKLMARFAVGMMSVMLRAQDKTLEDIEYRVIAPRQETMDPAKMAVADGKNIAAGIDTQKAILERKGMDYEEVLAQRKIESKNDAEVARMRGKGESDDEGNDERPYRP